MPYTAFTAAEIATPEPVKAELWQKVKDDFADHESRILTTEAATVNLDPIRLGVQGPYWPLAVPYTQVSTPIRIEFNTTLTAGRLLIEKAGTAGTTEIDVQYKRGAGAWTTIFSTRPSVAFGTGDNGLSTNGVLSVTALLAGDLLRHNLQTVQTGGKGYSVLLSRKVT